MENTTRENTTLEERTKHCATTLEELAKRYVAVYIDNCIIGTDTNNIFIREKKRVHLGGTSLSLADRLGAARGFSEVKQSNLNSHALQANRIGKIIANYEAVLSTPKIIKEYLQFLEHIACTLDYFKRKSKLKKAGKKETKLNEIIEMHEAIYTTFCRRNGEHPYGDCLSDFLYRRRMHLSYDGLFAKKKGNNKKEKKGNKKKIGDAGEAEGKVSLGDAELVGCALSHAFESEGNIAIVSKDLDVANLVRNFARDYHGEKLAYELKAEPGLRKLLGNVAVYFPSSQNWVPELGLRFICDTKGDFIFFEKEGSRIMHYSELSRQRNTGHQKNRTDVNILSQDSYSKNSYG